MIHNLETAAAVMLGDTVLFEDGLSGVVDYVNETNPQTVLGMPVPTKVVIRVAGDGSEKSRSRYLDPNALVTVLKEA